MKKLKFNFDELKVESFVTEQYNSIGKGTIIGNQLKTEITTQDGTCPMPSFDGWTCKPTDCFPTYFCDANNYKG